jgi:hypothetical protein
LLHIDIYHRDAAGRKVGLDHKAAELRYKAAKMIYDRAYPATQKIAYIGDKNSDKKQSIDIEEQIKLLEQKLKKNG